MLSRTKQTQSQPFSGVRGLAWHLCLLPSPGVGKALPFASALRQTRVLRQCLHHRREEATGSLHKARALGWGTVGDSLHSCPVTPPATHIASTSWWKTASDCPFLHGVVSASSVYGTLWQAQVCPWDRWPRRCCPLGTRGTGQACLLPRLLPQRGARASALVVRSCLLSSQASISPHRERGTLVLLLACCSCHGRLSCFPSVSRPRGQRILLVSGGGVLRLPHIAPGERGDRRVQPRFSLRQRGC